MPSSTSLTIDLPADVREKLDQVSVETRRSVASLATEALSAYAEHELAVIDGIKRGLADLEADRVVPHDEAMARLRSTIATTQERQARKK
ncbi:MAG: CopG family transcriptional regulator [Candidatus Devosia phytovorans]|uniref:CopG family transcriptional regulator n=1 Tax=Candidatus Devosia phytovorans TaxID=3121372 RepID=A0AAJ6B1F4_9HYPH|nr:CopG family transcriptional regulator [Devosia sp.]WEK04403.1 MAG: CopG family transcriptional regulator [Devosia sp.]